ncbi:MAG: type I 3-dehydroquinate dehydratase [Promethearchaeota archaeon]
MMSHGLIAVALRVYNKDQIIKAIIDAIKYQPDLIELRFDYLTGLDLINNFNPEDKEGIISFFSQKLIDENVFLKIKVFGNGSPQMQFGKDIQKGVRANQDYREDNHSENATDSATDSATDTNRDRHLIEKDTHLVERDNKQNLKKIRFIFTLRKFEQGGFIKINEPIRIELIKYLIKHKPAFIDIESDIAPNIIKSLTDLAHSYSVGVIFSDHNWEHTPPFNEIKSGIDNFIMRYKDLSPSFRNYILRSKTSGDKPRTGLTNKNSSFHSIDNSQIHVPNVQTIQEDVIKRIYMAKSINDNETMLKICKYYSERGINIVAFCMGELGVKSRIESVRHGALFSFASIGENTAPGQVHINEFRKRLNI